MISLLLLICVSSTTNTGTLLYSLENFISLFVSGFTSTTSYGTPWKSSMALTLLQKGHTSYWYRVTFLNGRLSMGTAALVSAVVVVASVVATTLVAIAAVAVTIPIDRNEPVTRKEPNAVTPAARGELTAETAN